MGSKKENFLVVGIDNHALVNSLKNAGCSVYIADYFGDLDIKRISDGFRSIIVQRAFTSSGKFEEKYDPQEFIGIVKNLAKSHEFEGALLSSGLDDSFQVLSDLNNICRIVGNTPEQIKKTRDKDFFFKELKKLDIIHPVTSIVRCLDSALVEAEEIGYPVLVKPFEGFAGTGIRKVCNRKQLEEEYNKITSFNEDKILVQEFIKGKDVSISFIAAYPGSKIISLNEQLIGLKKTYSPEPFGYCGNITPFNGDRTVIKKCKKIVDKITSRFKLLGSNGIDVVIKENTPYVIEVNPRFQGSLGCIERAYGVNLARMHIEACTEKKLPASLGNPSCFATRLIIFAPRRLIAPDLTAHPNISDVPFPNSIIEEGEPVCSINTVGTTRQESLNKAQKISNVILKQVEIKTFQNFKDSWNKYNC